MMIGTPRENQILFIAKLTCLNLLCVVVATGAGSSLVKTS